MMRPFLAAVWAVHRRNLRLVRRQKNLVAQTLALPLAILLLVAFIFGGSGDAWPVAVVDDSESQEGAEVLHALQSIDSEITPYFDIQPMPLSAAESRVNAGRLHMLVHIPADFPHDRTLRVHTFNVNSDAMKNVRHRLDYALNQLEAGWGRDGAVGVLRTERPEGVWRSAYIGGSSVLLALLLGSMLVAANLFVFELEDRTRTAILTSPVGPNTAGLGIIISALAVAAVGSLIPLVAAWGIFNLSVDPTALVITYVGIMPILVGCAGLGILFGQMLRSYRTVQPVIVLTALITFFGAGGFVAKPMLPSPVQSFSDVWLFSRIFGWFNPVLHGFAPGLTAGQWGGSLLAGMVGIGLVLYAYHRERWVLPDTMQ